MSTSWEQLELPFYAEPRVYVAGSSKELDRAKRMTARLHAAGVITTSHWVEEIELVGEANPRYASWNERRGWSNVDLDNVDAANILLCLVADTPSAGMYYEAGYARAHGMTVVFAGDTLQSIFTSQGEEYPDDDVAFNRIVKMVKG